MCISLLSVIWAFFLLCYYSRKPSFLATGNKEIILSMFPRFLSKQLQSAGAEPAAASCRSRFADVRIRSLCPFELNIQFRNKTVRHPAGMHSPHRRRKPKGLLWAYFLLAWYFIIRMILQRTFICIVQSLPFLLYCYFEKSEMILSWIQECEGLWRVILYLRVKK